MKQIMRAILMAAIVAATSLASGGSAVADINCAGMTELPDGATLASDRNGNAIVITASGLVIRCDGSGVFPLVSAPAMGLEGDQSAKATASTFVAPFGGQEGWTLVSQMDVSGADSFLLGYLGSNADLTVIFWRSMPGGPIETWVFGPTTVTP